VMKNIFFHGAETMVFFYQKLGEIFS